MFIIVIWVLWKEYHHEMNIAMEFDFFSWSPKCNTNVDPIWNYEVMKKLEICFEYKFKKKPTRPRNARQNWRRFLNCIEHFAPRMNGR